MLKNPVPGVSELVSAYAALPTAAVSDALDRLGFRGQCQGLRRVAGSDSHIGRQTGRLCGRVFTVQFLPIGPPDARTPNGDIGDYIDDVPEGYVVALDNRGDLDACVWDEVLTREAAGRQLAGTVIDGACRTAAAGATQYSIFARGLQPRHGKNRVRVEAYNLPIAIGGVRVECDDFMLGDADGLVVVPRDHVTKVLDTAREIYAARQD